MSSTHQDDNLMAHDYDGIREYDNPTPGWWHAIFIVCVLFAGAYLLFFHLSPYGWTIFDQQDATAKRINDKAQAILKATYGSLTPDQDNLVRLSGNTNALAAGKAIFEGRCAACHMPDGRGLVGPNLTDDFAKNYKMPGDIYKVVSGGVPGTAMVAWEPLLGRDDVVLAASYVISLRGAHPANPKAPEGEPLPEWPKPAGE
ncbi:MAG: c-type cytochrome [Phycisphaerales bacterium]|nr:c-type cytochrome [Phycisphaerales bacterium]